MKNGFFKLFYGLGIALQPLADAYDTAAEAFVLGLTQMFDFSDDDEFFDEDEEEQ